MTAQTKYSKFLSYVLRHRPDEFDLELDEAGWADIDTLLSAAQSRDKSWTLELLHEVVENNPKRRFEFSDDAGRIRARQGHSVDVDLGYEPIEPPPLLYHGTVSKFLDDIMAEGLRPMSRHHVHLSPDVETATIVASRRGKPLILAIDAAAMHADGHAFMCTENDVWLVQEVPSRYLSTALTG